MKLIDEFKEFAIKGNAIDLAIAVVIGASFNNIINSLVKDIITPIIGLVGGEPDFSNIALLATYDANGKVTGGIMLGNFLNVLLSFVIVAFVLFAVVKLVNKLKRSNSHTSTLSPSPTIENK